MKHEKNLKKLFQVKFNIISLVFILITVIVSCSDQEQSLDEKISLLNLQTLPEVTHPSYNPTSSQKVELGRLLFYDPILSGERNISCYTCHLPQYGYAEPLDLSIGPGGTGVGKNRVGIGARIAIRNSTGVVNSAYVGLLDANQELDVVNAPMTWTVNRRALEPQATSGALINPTHMRGSGSYDGNSVGDSLAQRIKKIVEYVALFDGAFGGGEASINKANIGNALGAFQRSLVSRNSPYDQYVKGNLSALTNKQKRGLLLFFGKANCSACHSGPMFSDFSLYNLGIKDHPALSQLDLGANGERLFRTPTLRNVTLTAPYMHNGTIETLEDVMAFYNKGLPENPNVSPNDISTKIKPLNLSSDEVDALLSFLEALTDEDYDKQIPSTVPSGLNVGGD